MKKQKVDLILRGGAVLTIDEKDRIIEDGAVAIRGNKIIAVGCAQEISAGFFATRTIDAKSGIIMPGLINTHTHLAMSLFQGIADDVTLSEWLNNFIFPLEDKFMDKNSVYWGSLLSCAEMILSGTTTFCDMYFFEKETGRAAQQIGMRGVIGEGIVAMGEEDVEKWEIKKALTLGLIKTFRKSELISIGIKPHSPYTCTARVLIEAKKFSREHGSLYIIHLAETKKEFLDFKKDRGMTPVEYLDSIGVLDENTLAAHAVWIDKDDFKILNDRQVKISHCPQSNMKLGSGIAPIATMLKNNITVSLGTDGSASNNTLDMFREMKCASLLAKVAALDASTLGARETIRMATIEGAKALGKENEIGSLQAGKMADLIIINLDKPHLTPIYDYYSHVVYSVTGADVRTAVINGKVIMNNRTIEGIDLKEVIRKVNTLSVRIKNHQEK